MLFWLFIILLFVGILLLVLSCKGGDIFEEEKHEKLHDFFWKYDDGIMVTGLLFTIVFGIVVGVMACVIVSENTEASAKVEQYRERYKALEFKVESKSYRDDFGLLNKEVIDEIQQWNEDVSYNKSIQRNFWLGIFYPNIYDEFETIDYERY